MKSLWNLALAVVLAAPAFAFPAEAGTITASGAVTALTDVSQITEPVIGTADFNAFDGFNPVPLDAYAAQGMDFNDGDLQAIFPGLEATGIGSQPYASSRYLRYFDSPADGGGSFSGSAGLFGGAISFTETVTQFGLTFSNAGTQYITAFDETGSIIGQVRWTPNSDTSFVGIDTMGVAIAFLLIGNDDVMGGAEYKITGPTTISDDWVWAGSPVPLPAAAWVFLAGLAGMGAAAGRKRKSNV